MTHLKEYVRIILQYYFDNLNQILLPGFVVLQQKHLPKLQHQPVSISAIKMKNLRYQIFAYYAKSLRYFSGMLLEYMHQV